jgi:glycine/D-amino acid oxidase-like deaminating enzyme
VTRRKIAVIGSGVSGITASYVLSHIDYVTIFEADGRLGGQLPALVAPLLMTFILTRGTGASMTDRRMKAARPGYADYVERTSGFIPLPAKKRAPKRRAAGPAPEGRA